MTALRNPVDSTALGWVKPELDALLHQARVEVEAWAEAPADTAALATCAQLLQQLRGSLQMLDLEAPARLVEDMRLLAVALGEQGVADTGAAGAALMRGLVQLPDYLERLQGGHRDVPVALKPLFDEIRAARGASAVDAGELAALGGDEPATEDELAHARAALGGRNRALLDTVAGAVKEDLMQVKDALDLHLRGAQSDAATLQPHADALGRIADTLTMIGLDGAARRIARQGDAMQAIAAGDRPASEDALLDIAAALLQVDASLDDQAERMGGDADEDLSAVPSRRATAALLHEAGTNLAHVREGVVAAMHEGWHASSLADVPRLLQEVGGALRILEQPHPADLASGVQAYVQAELLERGATPDASALDRLADAVTSLEMYLEAWGEGAAREDLLDITRASLATLGYWPLPAAGVQPAAAADAYTDALADAQPAETTSDDAATDVATPAVEAVAIAPATTAAAPSVDVVGFEQAGDEIDDEIREVFLEEFEEEIGNLGELLPAWRAEADNLDLLRPIRRVFHTLKGSGRLVGARLLGEFSWKIENMLNRVLDGSRPASPAVIALVAQAHAALPQLHAALRGEGAVSADLAGMEQAADRLAAGEEVRLAAAQPAVEAPHADEAGEAVVDSAAAEPAVAEPVAAETAEAAAAAASPEGIPASVDPVLFEILDAEVSGHLQTIDAWLQSGAPQADEPLLRALHTSYGAFAMTEVPAIGEVLGPAEGYAKRLLASGQPATPEGVAAIAAIAAVLRDTLDTLRTDSPQLRPQPELAAQLRALRDALPEPAAPQLEAAQADTLDALGIAGELPVPEVPLMEVEPLAATSVEALLHGHAGLASEHAEGARIAEQRAAAEREAAQQADAAALEAERVAFERAEAERLEAERIAAERAEAERLEAERLEVERLEAERVEAERIAAEQAEAERLEAERIAAEKAEAERLESERIAAEQAEAERLEAERIAAEQAEAERLEAERLEAERLAAEAERLEAERIAAEQAEAERLEAERIAAEQAEAARLEAERIETERLAAEAERLEAERIAAEQAEAERLEAERIAAEQAEAERLEAERLAGEQAEAERLEAERAATEQAEAERLEADRLAAEQAEAERVAAEQAEAERLEAERLEAERLAAEQAETERLEAERVAAEQAETERLEAERSAAELAARIAAAQALEAQLLEAERIRFEREEAERLAAERAEAERVEAERLAAEQAEAERLEAERLAAEQAEAERLEAERLAAEQAEAERLAAERAEAERVEAERLAAEQAEAARIAAEQAEARRIEAERVAAEQAEARRIAEEKAEAERQARKAEAEAARVAALLASAASAAAPEDPDEALDTTDLDPELLDLFVEEATDLLDHSDGLLAKLREAPDGRDTITGLQRDLHTIKGGARMAGVMAVGELGHAMESLLEAVAGQQLELGRDDFPLLERGFDRLHGMVTRVGARRAIGVPAGLIDDFNARARGEVPGQAAERPKVELAPLSAPIGLDAGIEDDDIGVRAPQEQVRVRADLLDRLVNYAGEVAIYRARLEQQLGAFRAAMFEMEQTNARLRDQLRRLDAETEAQIISRYQREHAAGHDAADPTFDPLELDRFSTLQQLSRALAESAADMASLQGTLDDLTRQYETLLLQQSRVSSDLQEGLMRTRMVPFDALVPRLRRVLRQAASDTGKQVQLKLDGAQGELDRNVLERMTAPLEHMLRNAVAHGLESPAARRKANKDEEGTVRIAVRREGSEVVLEIGDDGAGLDRAAIRRRGIERGLVRDDAVLADSDLDALIMQPGFSTADAVSRLAGRGTGMDVVASEVRQLGGVLDIRSSAGEGTRFTLRLPQTLAVTQAVFVRIGETSFAVPIASVRGVGRIAREELANPEASYSYGGEDYALHDLGALLGQAPARAEGQVQMPLLLVRSGDLRAAVAIDQVLGNREIVVKPVGPQVASVPGIFGATIMGDGSVVVILDVAPLVRRHAAQPRDAAVQAAPDTGRRGVPLVMVVDDSITMRKVTGRVLERHNYEVLTAKDGVDALERMEERVPDLMLLDIEMPRMDGYELAAEMRADPRLRRVPIIMITSRTGEKHRERAFQLGVQRYLGKPYQEPELMRNVFDLLGTGPVHDGDQD